MVHRMGTSGTLASIEVLTSRMAFIEGPLLISRLLPHFWGLIDVLMSQGSSSAATFPSYISKPMRPWAGKPLRHEGSN